MSHKMILSIKKLCENTINFSNIVQNSQSMPVESKQNNKIKHLTSTQKQCCDAKVVAANQGPPFFLTTNHKAHHVLTADNQRVHIFLLLFPCCSVLFTFYYISLFLVELFFTFFFFLFTVVHFFIYFFIYILIFFSLLFPYCSQFFF